MMIMLYLFFKTSVLVPCLVQDTTSHKTPISMLSMVKLDNRMYLTSLMLAPSRVVDYAASLSRSIAIEGQNICS